MGVLVEDLLTLARLDEVPEAPHAERRPRARSPRDAVDDARATAPEREIELRRRRPPRASSATPTSCARCSPTCCATRSSTRRPGTPIEVTVARRATSASGSRCATTGPACRPTTPSALFERFWRAEGGRERGKRRRRARAGDRRRHRRRPRRPRERANAPGGGAAFVVRLPARVPAVSATPRQLQPRSDGGADLRMRRRRTSCPRQSLAPQPLDVDIVVPVYNEQAGARAQRAAPAPLPRRRFPFSWRIVIADNASTDATPAIARALAASCRGVAYLRLERKGRGRALRAAWARERRARRRLHGRRPLDRPARRCCRWSRRCSPATATSRSARGWRPARGSCAGPSAS